MVATLGMQICRRSDRADLGMRDHFLDLPAMHDAISGQYRRPLRFTGESALLGQHVDDDVSLGRLVAGGRTILASAQARDTLRAEGQWLDGVGATLVDRARVIRAHGARQCIQPLIEDRTLRGIDAAVNLDHAVTDRFDSDPATTTRLPRPTHRIGVDVDDHPIHQLGDPLIGQRIPRRCRLGQLRIDDRHDVDIGDQGGAVQDDPQDAKIHGPGGEDAGEGRQPGDQVATLSDQGAGPASADPEFGTQFGGDQFPVVDDEILGRVTHLRHPGLCKLAGLDHLERNGLAFGP